MRDCNKLACCSRLTAAPAGVGCGSINGALKVMHGPFPEGREMPGGYRMIRVNSLDDAIARTKRFPIDDNAVIEARGIVCVALRGEADDPALRISNRRFR